MGTAKWFVEVGVDGADGDRDMVMEIAAGTQSKARELARMTQGKTIGELLTWAGADLLWMPDSGESTPVAGASIVYYDGEDTQHDTYQHIDF